MVEEEGWGGEIRHTHTRPRAEEVVGGGGGALKGDPEMS